MRNEVSASRQCMTCIVRPAEQMGCNSAALPHLGLLCVSLYHCVCVPSGLVKLGEELGLTFLAPRKKITVMLIGNHSAGKSSFINW